MKRFLAWLLVAALAVLLLGYLARNLVARKAIEIGVERQTGFPLRIAAVDLGLLAGRAEVRGLVLENPPEFPERTFVDLPLLRVRCDPLSVLKRRPHLSSIELDVREVVVVTSARGEKNTGKLARSAGSGGPKRGKKANYRVDLLRVHVGTVRIVDHSRGKRAERKLALNVDRTYRNISESTDISELVLGSVLGQLGPTVGDAGKGFGDVLKSAGGNVGRTGDGLLDTLRRR